MALSLSNQVWPSSDKEVSVQRLRVRSSSSSGSLTLPLVVQVLASFRSRSACPFLSVLRFSSFSGHLNKLLPHQERQHQRVTPFPTCFQRLTPTFAAPHGVCSVLPADVLDPPGHVCGVCGALPCRFLPEGSEAAVPLLWAGSSNPDAEHSCEGTSHLQHESPDPNKSVLFSSPRGKRERASLRKFSGHLCSPGSCRGPV